MHGCISNDTDNENDKWHRKWKLVKEKRYAMMKHYILFIKCAKKKPKER